jgi:hypothetical protein
MLVQHEQTQMARGIDEILFNLNHIPTEDVAHFLVKFNPKIAEDLATALQFEIFDRNEGIKHE